MRRGAYQQAGYTLGGDEQLKHRQRAAATKIQAFWRGYLARKAYLRLQHATRKIQAHAKGWYTRKKVLEQRERVARDAHFQATMARHRERIYALEAHKRLVLQQSASNIEIWHEQRNKAAAKVQAAWRGYIQRKKLLKEDPDRARRHQASMMHKEFKDLIAHAQTAHAKDVAASQQLHPRAALPAALTQSATVLIGSPEKGVAAAAAGGGNMARGQPTMSAQRYASLKKQVEARVIAHRSMAKHQRSDVHAVEARLKELLNEHHSTSADRLQAAHSRANQMVGLASLTATLDTGGLRPLSSLVDPDPVDFPRPARGSERWERAMQAHACDLADARAGSQWWRHLRPLNQGQLQQALIQEDEIRWQGLDGLWRYQWARVADAEARRPDPLAKMGTRCQPTVGSDLVEADTCTSRDQASPVPQQQGGTNSNVSMQATATHVTAAAGTPVSPPSVPPMPPTQAPAPVAAARATDPSTKVVQGCLGHYVA